MKSIEKTLQVKKDQFEEYQNDDSKTSAINQDLLSPQETKIQQEVQKMNMAVETDLIIKTRKQMFKKLYQRQTGLV